MPNGLEKLKKLKGRGRDELRERGAQKLSAMLERRGLSSQTRVPSDEAFFNLLKLDGAGAASAPALLERFRARTSPRFFASLDARDETRRELARRWPDEAERLRARAERIVEGRFDLLGLSDLSFGQPVDWHLEPVSGKRSPLVHWSAIEEIGNGETGDKKIVWELNRHQHFVTLGCAYLLTEDERYAEVFTSHLSSWMDENPPKRGVNWLSSLEVAFRAISWLWSLHLFKESPRLAPQLFLRAMKYLHIHARHIETYLSTYSSPNTHLTGEALGLYYMGTLLPEFASAARWRAKGMEIMTSALDRQVRPDGVYFEQASYYHRYTVEFYTHLLLLARANGDEPAGRLETSLTAMLDHLMHLTRPDGTTPLYGDDDGGKLLRFDLRAPDDFRPALSNAAAIFKRADYKYVAGGAAVETLWLLGPDGMSELDRIAPAPPSRLSRAFPDGGYYVMRDGWGRDANYLLIDCGPHGTLNCGHAHADALSINLAARGRTLLIDPGTYTYTGSRELRDYFRGTAAHNTLTVDGEHQSVPAGPFSWAHIAQATPRAWTTREAFDYFAGEHDGYHRLDAPATHRREVLFIKGAYWVVADSVETRGEHRYEIFYHFEADAYPRVEPGDEEEGSAAAARALSDDAPGLEMFAFGGGEWRRETGRVSRVYGEMSHAPVLVREATGRGSVRFITLLVPRAASAERARAREIETDEGECFEIACDGWRDLLLAGAARTREGLRIESDFSWAWARTRAATGRLERLILIDGSRLVVDGREVVSGSKRVAHAHARREGGDLVLETDDESARVPFFSEAEREVSAEMEAAG